MRNRERKIQFIGGLFGLAAVVPIALFVTPSQDMGRAAFGVVLGLTGTKLGELVALIATGRGKRRS